MLIINNKVFHNDPGSSNTRHGTDNDVARLKQVFEKLDFGVEEKRDLTAAVKTHQLILNISVCQLILFYLNILLLFKRSRI